MNTYTVSVDITMRREVSIKTGTPEEAARRVVEHLKPQYPEFAQVKVNQVDYETPEGGESRWFPECSQ